MARQVGDVIDVVAAGEVEGGIRCCMAEVLGEVGSTGASAGARGAGPLKARRPQGRAEAPLPPLPV